MTAAAAAAVEGGNGRDLILRLTQTSRRNHFDAYRCSATNDVTGEEKVSSPFHLKVRFKDEADLIRCRRSAESVSNMSRSYHDRGWDEIEMGNSIIDKKRVDDLFDANTIQVICKATQYPLMRLTDFKEYVEVVPEQGFRLGRCIVQR